MERQTDTGLPEERNELAETQQRADTYLDLAQRAQADFVNYKRRVERERSEDRLAGRADLLNQLLPVLDDFERAEAHAASRAAGDAWTEGALLAIRKLQALLATAGLERLEPARGDQFDPQAHEATAYEFDPQLAEGRIAEVYRPGYQVGGRVLRPAQVVVSRGANTGSERAARRRSGAADARPDLNGGSRRGGH